MLIGIVTQATRSFCSATSEVIAFLRRPTVETVKDLSVREKCRIGICLFILSITVTMIFGVLALPMLFSTDLTSGDQLNEVLRGSIWSVLLSVVILGPLVEEIIFRGWLSGTWRAALATVFSLLAIYGGAAILSEYCVESSAIKSLILAACALTVFCVFSPPGSTRRIVGFDRVFPFLFYAQAAAFGTLHFQNYAASSPVIALFATLPLVACGLIWGYARIRLGLISAVILHAAYNVPAAIGSIIMLHYAG